MSVKKIACYTFNQLATIVSQRLGKNLTKRMAEHWQRVGIFPKPRRIVGKDNRGVLGVYADYLVDQVVKPIFNYRDQESVELCDIQVKAKDVTKARYESTVCSLSEKGVSTQLLVAMKCIAETNPSTVNREMKIWQEGMKKAGITDNDIKGLGPDGMIDEGFEVPVTEKLHWWDSDINFQETSMRNIGQRMNGVSIGLNIALQTFAEELYNNKESKGSIDILEKLIAKSKDVKDSRSRIKAHLDKLPQEEYILNADGNN